MLYITAFKNYTEFQELFGVRQFDNGKKARKNKILLALLKDKVFFREAVKSGNLYPFGIKNMTDLRNYLAHRIHVSGAKSKKLCHKIWLLDRYYYSDKYTLDEMAGVCEDGTPNAVRYVNTENNRPWKMKAGKFYKHLIESTAFGKKLNQTLVIWLCEEFTRDWTAHVIGRLPKNKLYVNDNFSDIYNSERLKGYDSDSDAFCSCMTNKGYHNFYKNAVKAKAAYLEDETGMIIARCVIFTDVYDEDGNKYRYAERQYSTVADKRFYIDCDLDWEDDLSYQDTFKNYSMSRREADNWGRGDYSLDVTEGSLDASENVDDDEPDEWDSYHERNAWEVRTVYYHGNEETCDIECCDDFVRFNDKWYHEDDVVTCPKCGEKMLNPAYYDEDDDVYDSSITGKGYCCEDCRDEAELEYKKEHWHYSDYDDEYYLYANDITTYRCYNCITQKYEDKTISKESLFELIERGDFHEWGGMYFDAINEEVGKPIGYEDLIEFNFAA